MSYGLVGLYALFLIFAGVNGNASALFKDIETDAKGFAPWLLSIIILEALYKVDALKPAIKPFIGLAALTFVLKNYDVVISQVDEITGLHLPTSTNAGTAVGASAASATVGDAPATSGVSLGALQGALSILKSE